MSEEPLAAEFKRLMQEYELGLGSDHAEAWNLLADFAVDNYAIIHSCLLGLEANKAP